MADLSLPPGLTLLRTLQGHTDEVDSVAWSPDGTWLASGSADGTASVWDASNGHNLLILRGHTGSVHSVAWSSDGTRLASASADQIVRVWDASSGRSLHTLKGHTNSVQSVAWSPDGTRLASGSVDQTLRVWSANNSRPLHTLKGHTESVQSVAWSPDTTRLASGSTDQTLCVWDASSGYLLRTLQGHTSPVTSVAWSPDGSLLASASDGELRLWRTDTWEMVAVLTNQEGLRLVTWNPHLPQLVTVGQCKQGLALWQVDLPRLLPLPRAASLETVQYKSAKVVLVGESGVGKSGLALRLTGQPFVATESTHARHVWPLETQEVLVGPRVREQRETWLWDLAGQRDYRLLHQLHLHEATVALIVFDAARDTDALSGIRYWQRALRLAQRDATGSPLRILLVAARTDRGRSGVSRQQVEALARELDCVGYVETSAKTGQGLDALAQAMRAALHWERLPGVTSTTLLQEIKTFLLAEGPTGRMVHTVEELYQAFLLADRARMPGEALHRQFETVLGQVEGQGALRRLSFGNLVLLQPERLDGYASALLIAAGNEPDGLGIIAEARVQQGQFAVPEEVRLADHAQEQVLLIAMIEELVRHDLALRDGGSLLFPSQPTREHPEQATLLKQQRIIFRFAGPVLSIYTTLVVRLAQCGVFQQEGLWHQAATYTTRLGGRYGLLLTLRGEERAEVGLCFDEAAREEMGFHFEAFVRQHLERLASGSVERRRQYVCSQCGFPALESFAQQLAQQGIDRFSCPKCHTMISLLDRKERIITSSSSVVTKMEQAANAGRDQQSAQVALQGKIAMQDFDVFLCHNQQDKPAVKHLGEQLKQRGILPWLDEWELRPGLPWQHELENQITKIKAVAVFVGKSGIGPWQQQELDAFLREFVQRGCPVIPVLLSNAAQKPELPIFLKNVSWVDFRVQEPEPMQRLLWGITGRRDFNASEADNTNISLLLPSQRGEILQSFEKDINDIRLAIGDNSFHNYQHLAMAIIRRMSIIEHHMLEAPHFVSGTAWEVTLPTIGLRLHTQKAMLVLRQKEEDVSYYSEIIKRAQQNGLILLIDIAHVAYTPLQTSPRTICFSPNDLIEMIETSTEELSGWLGRFITTTLEANVKQSLLPYTTEGAAKLFVGRDHELMRLMNTDQWGGIITGAHKSGKTSLLMRLKEVLPGDGLKVIGPFVLGKIGFQTFFERTLGALELPLTTNMNPEAWASALRTYRQQGTIPLFLLDEVDDLLDLDNSMGHSLGRQMRSLQIEGHCAFYLAGHAKLRSAIHLQYGPFKNFTNEVTLTGVTKEASRHLTQMEMKKIGFNVSDTQAQRIFSGTAGVPFLIQDFCIRLLCGLSPGQASKPDIDDSAIEEVEQSPDYLKTVYDYYLYAPTWDSTSVMLITTLLKEVSRKDILREFENRHIALQRARLDEILDFLVEFGVIKASTPDRFMVLSQYLIQAIVARDPQSLLDSLMESGRQEGGVHHG